MDNALDCCTIRGAVARFESLAKRSVLHVAKHADHGCCTIETTNSSHNDDLSTCHR